MPNKRGLGRGLDALIPSELAEPEQYDPMAKVHPGGELIEQVNPDQIKPNPHQPRQNFDQAALDELADSIKTHGVVQPLVATKMAEGGYELIAGERRLRAAKLAGLATVPVIVRSLDDRAKLEVALIENVQRAELNPIETALAYKKLIDQFNFKLDDVSKRVGKNISTISNTIRLLNLDSAAMQALVQGKISEGHARAILAVDSKNQAEMLKMILERSLTVRQAENLARGFKAPTSKPAVSHLETENQWTAALAKRLGTSVAITRRAQGGRLVISYNDDQDLERIANNLLKD